MQKVLIWTLALTLLLPSTLVTLAFCLFLKVPPLQNNVVPTLIKEEPKAVIKVSIFGWGIFAAIIAVILT